MQLPGDVGTVFHLCETLGMYGWRDMNQPDLTEQGMMQGVYDSDVFILFLTSSVLSRKYCQKEIGWVSFVPNHQILLCNNVLRARVANVGNVNVGVDVIVHGVVDRPTRARVACIATARSQQTKASFQASGRSLGKTR